VGQFVWPGFDVPLLERQEKGGETGETGEEFDLFAGSAGFIREELIRWRQWVAISSMIELERRSNNSILTGLTGLTGLADRARLAYRVG
jgi:hypothetical protein